MVYEDKSRISKNRGIPWKILIVPESGYQNFKLRLEIKIRNIAETRSTGARIFKRWKRDFHGALLTSRTTHSGR